MTTVAASVSPDAPITVGPVWARSEDGKWLLPADNRTLGWQVIGWAGQRLYQPDGPDAGQPWRWTAEQARFLLWWYAINDEGRFVYRRGVLRRMKGWGKDPLAAAISAVELLGPCRFGGWNPNGEPVAVPAHAPWIQIVAVTGAQNRNTMTLFPNLFGGKQKAKRAGIDLGKEIIYGPGGGRIESITSSPRAAEGGRPTLAIKSETHHWLATNEGHAMDEVIARNLAKSRDGSARALAITNAHEPGEDSVAERDWGAWQQVEQGSTIATGILYDSLEAPPTTVLADPDSLRAGIIAARGDSVWLHPDRLMEEIYDPRTPVSMSRRFYLNQIVAPEDALFGTHEWEQLRSTERLTKGDTIVAFFDGSSGDDHTGIVACRVKDGLLAVLCHETPGTLGIDRDAVDSAVAAMFREYDVAAFYCDVREWESYIDRWRDDYGHKVRLPAQPGRTRRYHPLAWDMRFRQAEFTAAVDRFVNDVAVGDISHTGDPALSAHIANCRRARNRWGYSVRKDTPDSPRKIDLAVCAIGARMARRDVIAAGVGIQPIRYAPVRLR